MVRQRLRCDCRPPHLLRHRLLPLPLLRLLIKLPLCVGPVSEAGCFYISFHAATSALFYPRPWCSSLADLDGKFLANLATKPSAIVCALRVSALSFSFFSTSYAEKRKN